MFESFVNPWSMAAGAALVSAPVIIHLINRMRYKRVRWAAMEFLLKAQKRVRRKMIVEQLLLLLLRCLLVLLLGVLVGRFLGFSPLSGGESRTTAHVVVLDDTPSMADGWRGEDGQPTDPFEQAKQVIAGQIVPAAAQATTPQTLDVLRLSDLATPRSFGRLSAATPEDVKGFLAGVRPSPVRTPLVAGLNKVRDALAAPGGADLARVVHVVSDFRTGDWTEGADALRQAVTDLGTAGVKVHLIDVAHPYRKDEKRPPLFHDNVGIIEFRPTRAAVARYEAAEFVLRVRNFGTTELKDVRFAVAVNGDDNKGRAVSFTTLPAGQEKAFRFELTFDRVGTADRPLDRFSLVTARLDGTEAGGITADNSRHAVIEVRDRLPVLGIDGRPADRDKKEGDSFYLRSVITSDRGPAGWAAGTAADLDRAELRDYACVLLMNVPTLPEAAVKNLARYVRGGGGVGFFAGPDVKPADYNKLLYAGGTGLFPVPLEPAATEPLSEERRTELRFTLNKKLLLRDPAAQGHPALRTLYRDDRDNPEKDQADWIDRQFLFVVTNRHWPVKRLGEWTTDRAVTELYCLPNDRPMADFEPLARRVADALPVDAPEFGKYRDVLAGHRDQLKRLAASAEPLSALAAALDKLLGDAAGDGGPADALLREFWAEPKAADVRRLAAEARDASKYGDPLLLTKRVGAGRVSALLTTAGEAWTDWPGGFGKASFAPVMNGLVRYLSAGGADENRLVGAPVELTVDGSRYKPVARRALLTYDALKAAGGPPVAPEPVDLKDQPLEARGDDLVLDFRGATAPGAYLFGLTSTRPVGGQPGETAEAAEYRAVAANVDAAREGDLRRAGRDEILQAAPGAALHSPDDAGWLDDLKNKKTDLSESGWLFLALLAVLAAEQAMAVRLSYHAGPGELAGAAPSAAAVTGRRWGHHAGEPVTTGPAG